MTQEYFEEWVDKSAEINEILDGIEDFDEFSITIRSAINNWCKKRNMSNLFALSTMYEKERKMTNELRKMRKENESKGGKAEGKYGLQKVSV